MSYNYFSALLKVVFILCFSMLSRDLSPRTVMEEVFTLGSDEGLDVGELDQLLVAPSRSYPFIACNDSNEEKVYIALASYIYELDQWMSYGWLPLSKGCSLIDQRMRGPVYGYAISSNKQVIWGGQFQGKSSPFCLNSSNSFNSSLNSCKRGFDEDLTLQLFSRLHVPSSSSSGFSKPVFWRIKSSEKLFSH